MVSSSPLKADFLLLLQHCFYEQGGLKTEGFDLPGSMLEDADELCFAWLIEAWLRELPGCLLDALPEILLIDDAGN